MSEASDILKYASTADERLLELFAAARVVTVCGVVDADGASGSKSQGDELWFLAFAFAAWRIHGAAVQTTRLHLHRKVTREQLETLVKEITSYRILRVRARVVVDPAWKSPQAFLEGIEDFDGFDQELNQHAEELQRPITRTDRLFGTLSFDRRFDLYAGQVSWCGASVEVSLSAREDEDFNATLKTGYSLWQNQEEWRRRIQGCAVAQLLPLKNDVWLQAGEGAVTPTEFLERMVLDSISVYADGSFEFLHSDGDLFWGHCIVVTGNLEDGPTDADIAG